MYRTACLVRFTAHFLLTFSGDRLLACEQSIRWLISAAVSMFVVYLDISMTYLPPDDERSVSASSAQIDVDNTLWFQHSVSL